MPSLSFKYVEEKGFYRPKIPFYISAGGNVTKTVGLLDSGSDFVVIPQDIAEALGIKMAKGIEEGDGIGGSIKLKTGTATIIVGEGPDKRTLRKIKIRITIDGNMDDILLGRAPFFNFFQCIEFNEIRKRVKLVMNRYSEPSNRACSVVKPIRRRNP